MNILTLSDDEIEEITQRKHRSAQVRVLNQLKIPCAFRPDRSIVVLRSAVIKTLGNSIPSSTGRPKLRL
ncbi:DUF4224 domain-containing protein [Advenella kashmirensis]|uniref:DUF4224 domain-containing protein n=1 Tax=Advenella kashmirensis TaxID=310575 RepID=UPI0009DE9871